MKTSTALLIAIPACGAVVAAAILVQQVKPLTQAEADRAVLDAYHGHRGPAAPAEPPLPEVEVPPGLSPGCAAYVKAHMQCLGVMGQQPDEFFATQVRVYQGNPGPAMDGMCRQASKTIRDTLGRLCPAVTWP